MVYYSYDGSFDGFLCTVYQIFLDKLPVCIITDKANPTLFQVKHVTTELWRCRKVSKKLALFDRGKVFQRVFYAFYSRLDGVEDLLLKYIIQALKPDKAKKVENVPMKVIKIASAVGRECHRCQGFLRFEEIEEGVLYSTVEPKYDVLPIIAGHFNRRFREKNWIIQDKNRGYAASSTNGNVKFLKMDSARSSLVSAEEAFNQNLWKEYFSNTTIEERKNIKLQKKMIPQRYRKNLTETKYEEND